MSTASRSYQLLLKELQSNKGGQCNEVDFAYYEKHLIIRGERGPFPQCSRMGCINFSKNGYFVD